MNTKEGLDSKTVTFIFQSKYWLKQYSTPKSKWRKKIALSYVRLKVGNSDKFLKAWNYLDKEGLIYE